MSLIVAVVNQKGGVGKTTTAINVAAALAESGKRVLLVDGDPQGNASSGLGFAVDDQPCGLYLVLAGQASIQEELHSTGVPNLSLLPASVHLAGAEVELAPSTTRSEIRECLRHCHAAYDYVLIDTPPSLGVLTLTCLVAAEKLLIPIQCEYYALEGLRQLMRTIELIRQQLNPDLGILGLVRTMYDVRTKLSQQVSEDLARFFPQDVFSTIIPRSVRLSEAPSYGEPIITYDPRSVGAEAYRALAREICLRTISSQTTEHVVASDQAVGPDIDDIPYTEGTHEAVIGQRGDDVLVGPFATSGATVGPQPQTESTIEEGSLQ